VIRGRPGRSRVGTAPAPDLRADPGTLVVGGAAPSRAFHDVDPEEYPTMAAVCDVCGKGPGFGMSVSHSHRRTHRRWNPNIQTVRARLGGGNRQRFNVCTSCLKAGKITRA
jgi:large subunit ribosomal protein L28